MPTFNSGGVTIAYETAGEGPPRRGWAGRALVEAAAGAQARGLAAAVAPAGGAGRRERGANIFFLFSDWTDPST